MDPPIQTKWCPDCKLEKSVADFSIDRSRTGTEEKELMEQKPSVGRIVHYQAYGTPGGEFKSLPRAAVITDVHEDDEVTVCVLNPSGIFFNRVKYSAESKPGCWNWPPRV